MSEFTEQVAGFLDDVRDAYRENPVLTSIVLACVASAAIMVVLRLL